MGPQIVLGLRLALAALALGAPGCAATPSLCAAGEQRACTCGNGSPGLQVCLSDQTYGLCTCMPRDAGWSPASDTGVAPDRGLQDVGAPPQGDGPRGDSRRLDGRPPTDGARRDSRRPDGGARADAATFPNLNACRTAGTPMSCNTHCLNDFAQCSTACAGSMKVYLSNDNCQKDLLGVKLTTCAETHAAGTYARCCCTEPDVSRSGLSSCVPIDPGWGSGDCKVACQKLGKTCSETGCRWAKVGYNAEADCERGYPSGFSQGTCGGTLTGLPKFVRCCCK
ncbi:MAG: hypothetical protein IT371_25920 [Deltaproteobacteria bacterium]|nr:hypothetical protein [Deltaproteobacteria bacterium]